MSRVMSRRGEARPAGAGRGAAPAESVGRWVQRHRRPLAAACAAAAVLLLALRSTPPAPPSTTAVVAARDLPAGALLGADDLGTREVPAFDHSAAPLASEASAVGRVLVVPLAAGTPITSDHLAGPGALAAQVRAGGEPLAAVPVRLADAGVAALLQPGDTVDVWATPSSALAAGDDPSAARDTVRVGEALRVLAVPRPSRGGGLLAGSDPAAPTGGLVVLAVPTRSVAVLVRAATDRLAVAVRPAATEVGAGAARS